MSSMDNTECIKNMTQTRYKYEIYRVLQLYPKQKIKHLINTNVLIFFVKIVMSDQIRLLKLIKV